MWSYQSLTKTGTSCEKKIFLKKNPGKILGKIKKIIKIKKIDNKSINQ